MRRWSLLLLLLIAVAPAAAAFAADASFTEPFDTLAAANASNNVTIDDGALRAKRANLSWDVDNATQFASVAAPNVAEPIDNVEWGRNGTRLYLLADSEIYQFAVSDPYNASTASFALSTGLTGDYRGLEFSPDGRYLLTIDRSSSPSTVDRYVLSTRWQIAPLLIDARMDLVGAVAPTDIQASPGGSHFLIDDVDLNRFVANESVPWWPDELEETPALDSETIEYRGNNTYLNFTGLDSDDWVQVPDSPSLDITNDITIAMRTQLSESLDVNANNNFRGVISKSNPAGDYSIIFEEDGLIDWTVRKGNSRENIRGCSVPVGVPFSLVVTHDVSTGLSRIYLNGSQCLQGTRATGPIDTNNGDVEISSDANNREYPGLVEDVIIDGSEWSPSDVSEYHAGNLSIVEDARFVSRFGSGIGAVAVDDSGFDNDGSINNPDWESGEFGPAGDRLIAQAANRTLFAVEADDYILGEGPTVADVETPTGIDNETESGLAVVASGHEIVTAEDGNIALVDAGYRPDPFALYRYRPDGIVDASRLTWTIEDSAAGTPDILVGIQNGPDGARELRRVGVGVGQQGVWQDWTSEWSRALVRVEPHWSGNSTQSVGIATVRLDIDLLDALDRPSIDLAVLVLLLAMIASAWLLAVSLRSALFAVLGAIAVTGLALFATGIVAASVAVGIAMLSMILGALAVGIAWEVI